jgi:transcriptional regulator with XRE-family HTH domain
MKKLPQRKSPPLSELGATLEEARRKSGLTQAKAARIAGISRRHFVEGLRGQNMSVVVLKKMMRTLDLVAVDLGNGLMATASIDGVQAIEIIALLETFSEGLVEIERTIARMRESIGASRAFVQRQVAATQNTKAKEVVKDVVSAHGGDEHEKPRDGEDETQRGATRAKRRRRSD